MCVHTHAHTAVHTHTHTHTHGRSWCLGPELTALFDDKAAFSEYAASLGLRVPRHHAVTSKAQLRALNSRQVRVGASQPSGGVRVRKREQTCHFA
jgi:hypothetical protein